MDLIENLAVADNDRENAADSGFFSGWKVPKLLKLEIFEFRCFSTTLWSLLKSIEGEYSLELEKRLKLKK